NRLRTQIGIRLDVGPTVTSRQRSALSQKKKQSGQAVCTRPTLNFLKRLDTRRDGNGRETEKGYRSSSRAGRDTGPPPRAKGAKRRNSAQPIEPRCMGSNKGQG